MTTARRVNTGLYRFVRPDNGVNTWLIDLKDLDAVRDRKVGRESTQGARARKPISLVVKLRHAKD